ncbi:MAG: C40 family peptidase [Sphingobacterium sp.]
MAFAICTLSSVSVLESPEFSAKRVYELLFGETLVIVERGKAWCQVQLPGGNQNGWMMEGQYEIVDEPARLEQIVDDVGGYALTGSDATIELYQGSPLPLDMKLQTDRSEYRFLGDGRSTSTSFDAERDRQLLEDFVVTYLHTPFLFKGRTKHGLDAIGLCDLFYRQFGVVIASQIEPIVALGETVNLISEIKDGDIAFFENDQGAINHLGIVISQNEILHVVEKVRIDRLDDEGVFNQQVLTHKLKIVKRLF